MLALRRQLNAAWVAKNACTPANNSYFSASRGNVEALAAFLVSAADSIEFCAIGVLGMDTLPKIHG